MNNLVNALLLGLAIGATYYLTNKQSQLKKNVAVLQTRYHYMLVENGELRLQLDELKQVEKARSESFRKSALGTQSYLDTNDWIDDIEDDLLGGDYDE